MSTTQSPQRKPLQTFVVSAAAYPEIPPRLLNAGPAPPTPTTVPATSSTAAFSTPSAAVPAAPKETSTASSPPIAVEDATLAPEPVAAEVPGRVVTVSADVDLDGTDVVGADVTEMATPVATGTAVASGTQSAVAEPQNAAVTMSPGGIAMGSIAGVAFLASLVFLLYKWRRGTLPQTLDSAARTLKLRSRNDPAPEADSMEKGLKSDAASIRSQSASIHSVSSLTSTFSSLKRSVSRTSSGSCGREMSRPVGEGQGDKLAVPVQLQLAKLDAAGLWTVDAEGGAGPAGAGKLNPRPVVEGPDVHPLRAHRVRREGVEGPATWPL